MGRPITPSPAHLSERWAVPSLNTSATLDLGCISVGDMPRKVTGAAGEVFVPLSQGCQTGADSSDGELSQLLRARFSVAYELEHSHVSWLLRSPP